MRRRPVLRCGLPLMAGLAGCSAWVDEAARGAARAREAVPPVDRGAGQVPAVNAQGPATMPRRLDGGFLAPAGPLPGRLQRAAGGVYVKFHAPTALALRGVDLLVADAADSRLWRVDLMLQTLYPVAGAPVGIGTCLWLGTDRSAWVMDPATRQVLRFANDGRLLQTWRGGAPARGGFAVLDGGGTLLVADTTRAGWFEWRSGGAVELSVRPQRADGSRLSGVDALALGRSDVFVLEQAQGAVHRVTRAGKVVDTLAHGLTGQWSALAVDADDTVWLVDGQGRSLLRLAPGEPPRLVTATALAVQVISGVAFDGPTLAVSDRLTGAVLLHARQGLSAESERAGVAP